MTAQENVDTENFSLQDLSFTVEEAATRAVELGWYGSFRRALQAVKMARGTFEPEKKVARAGKTWIRII